MANIGVLTKADEVRENVEQKYWIEVARNLKPGNTFDHGYYVTRLARPDELENNPTWNQIREQERAFFSDLTNWTAPYPDIQRGTEALTSKLSELLCKKIKHRLSSLRYAALT